MVLGDDMYVPPGGVVNVKAYPHPPRLCLHATRLGFKHPSGGKWVHFETPLPGDLAAYAKKVGVAV
jgi:23S rRNA pseudouridine1911/1915/1917 synthase